MAPLGCSGREGRPSGSSWGWGSPCTCTPAARGPALEEAPAPSPSPCAQERRASALHTVRAVGRGCWGDPCLPGSCGCRWQLRCRLAPSPSPAFTDPSRCGVLSLQQLWREPGNPQARVERDWHPARGLRPEGERGVPRAPCVRAGGSLAPGLCGPPSVRVSAGECPEATLVPQELEW